MSDTSYKARHIIGAGSFTRSRKLPFLRVLGFQLSKSLKSLQIRLNELLCLSEAKTVTSSAYSQARKKYSHTAFIELSDFTRDYYYRESTCQRWHGFRVIAIDGSLLSLPNGFDIVETFGTRPTPRTKSSEPIDLPMCRLLSSYDVLNHIIHASKLSACNSYEAEETIDLLSKFKSDDVVLFDRHYASYDFIARLSSQGCQFVIRCPNSTFREGQRVFSGGPWTKTATLTAPGGKKKILRQAGLPLSVTVRFVRVKLDNGETEVLVTSLDNSSLKSEDFHYLYGLRWGVETLFDVLKNRLNLENFTGYSVESVKQDIFSSIFITNMETILTEDVNTQLKQASMDCRYIKKVNRAVSFNAIKNEVFNIIYSTSTSIDQMLERLTRLFAMSPTLIRPGRSFERNKNGPYRKLRHHKSKRKICF